DGLLSIDLCRGCTELCLGISAIDLCQRMYGASSGLSANEKHIFFIIRWEICIARRKKKRVSYRERLE
ncbi:MAG: hypothetical protein PUC44_06570, partial [Eubacteriales bacterium]|nr:hypothetical protein [Eubacteriales bacterium]